MGVPGTGWLGLAASFNEVSGGAQTCSHALFPQSVDSQAEGEERDRLVPSCYVCPLSNVTLISQKHSQTDPHRALLREPGPANRPAGEQLVESSAQLVGGEFISQQQLFCLCRPQGWEGLGTMC